MSLQKDTSGGAPHIVISIGIALAGLGMLVSLYTTKEPFSNITMLWFIAFFAIYIGGSGTMISWRRKRA